MRLYLSIFVLLFALNGFVSCDDNDTVQSSEPSLIVKFKFDKNQERLNNVGQPSEVAAGNAAVSPDFNTISAHYFELAPNAAEANSTNTTIGKLTKSFAVKFTLKFTLRNK